jgi:hypothetical protein
MNKLSIYCTIILTIANSFCYSQVQFKKHTLTNDFISEGVAVGDVNKDGKLDPNDAEIEHFYLQYQLVRYGLLILQTHTRSL